MIETPLAFEDHLTGAYNRRYLSHLLEASWADLRARHDRLTVILIDLDSFKEVNDRHGHRVGDEVLCATVALLREHFRRDDVIVRYGGDEFVVVSPGAGRSEAERLAERVRAIGQSQVLRDGRGRRVRAGLSFSIGVATCPEDGDSGTELLEVADRRLYLDKRRRRRRHGLRFWRSRGRLSAISAVLGVALLVRFGLPMVQAPAALPPPPAPMFDGFTGEPIRLSEALLQTQIDDLERELAFVTERADRVRQSLGPSGVPGAVEASGLDAQRANLERELEELGAGLPSRVGRPELSASGGGGETVVEQAAAEPTPGATLAPDRPAMVVHPPTIVREVRPLYPPAARAMRREANIDVHVTVDDQGQVISADVMGERIGLGFEQAAREAALKTRFAPATRDGIAVAGDTTLRYRFVLD